MRDYAAVKESFKNFFVHYYHTDDEGHVHFMYAEQLTKVAHREQITFIVKLDDLHKMDKELTEAVVGNTKIYTNIVYDVVYEMLPDYKHEEVDAQDALDTYMEEMGDDRRHRFPPELIKQFEVYFMDLSVSNYVPVHKIQAEHFGKFISVKGVVTRISVVRPMLVVATYLCSTCGAYTYQAITAMEFTPPAACTAEECRLNNTAGQLHLLNGASMFQKFQELKIQELSHQVPEGHTSRQLSVHCRGETTRRAQPGDHVAVSGVLLPLDAVSGEEMRQAPPLFNTYLEAHNVVCVNQIDETEMEQAFTKEELSELSGGDLYSRMALSLAPEIYGHEDVKKALLLLLLCGVGIDSNDVKIRGNINMFLMGDPGRAKAQLLRRVHRLAPRGQLASGRGSPGGGLCASLVKNQFTGETVLEGGALVLADEGVCCIDEFDKMAENDRTTIHEVMEQQSISIARDEITATLNARVSILAAANPAYGRYNPKRSVEENIQLPATLLSCFDLIWYIQDTPNR